MNRRSAVALCVAAGLFPIKTFAKPKRLSETSDPLAGMVVVNTLGGLEDPNKSAASPYDVSTRSISDNLAGGVTAMIVTAADVTPAAGYDYFEQTIRDVAQWNANLSNHAGRLVKVERVADLLAGRLQGKLGIVLGLQNGEAVGNRADRIDLLADLGIRSFQLTYNGSNLLGDGGLVPKDRGLSALGREVIERANAKRVMVDLSHSGRQTCLDAVRHSDRPISINHCGCAGVAPSARNKTDEELRLVAEKGGYVGIYTMPYLATGRRITGDDVVAHIEHAMRICGEDHVGIGTDNAISGIDDIKGYMAEYARIVAERRKLGISAPGEDPAVPRFAADLDGPDQFRVLARKLAARGHSRTTIEKIMGTNFMAFAREIWQG